MTAFAHIDDISLNHTVIAANKVRRIASLRRELLRGYIVIRTKYD